MGTTGPGHRADHWLDSHKGVNTLLQRANQCTPSMDQEPNMLCTACNCTRQSQHLAPPRAYFFIDEELDIVGDFLTKDPFQLSLSMDPDF